MVKELIGVNAAARLLSVSDNTVRDWERRGKLRSIKTDRGVRLFERQYIEKVVAEKSKSEASK